MLASGKLAPHEALAIVPQICEALQYAHDVGVVHRDIKPENILLDRKGRVKIADFGLANVLGRPEKSGMLTGSRQVMGTPYYMAPEQIERPQEVDHRADIYSLGVVFYEMLTGELPLGRFAPPSRKVDVDARLDEVVLRALESEPERRYQYASEVKTDVERLSQSSPPPTRPVEASATTAAPTNSWTASDIAEARDEVQGPAIGLLVLGVLHCLSLVVAMMLGVWYFLAAR
jgi:serine/threonine protein kinase